MKTLLIVDIQNDFVEGGALEVKKGSSVIPIINNLQNKFDLIVATQDWHPENHGSFASNHKGQKPGNMIELNGLPQVLWPVHCVQGSKGAQFVDSLDLENIDKVFTKGTDPRIDSYSGFYDNGHKKPTGLEDYLKDKQVTNVYIVGLATDYCVKYTALDSLKAGFNTFLIKDACKGVELNEGDINSALEEMEKQGVKIILSSELLD